MNRENFRNVAKNSNNIGFSDEDLLESIQVLQCMLEYFHERKETMIANALHMELNTLNGFAFSRGWTRTDDEWTVKKRENSLQSWLSSKPGITNLTEVKVRIVLDDYHGYYFREKGDTFLYLVGKPPCYKHFTYNQIYWYLFQEGSNHPFGNYFILKLDSEPKRDMAVCISIDYP